MKREFKTLNSALDVLETSDNKESRALAFLLRFTLEGDYDMDYDLDNPVPEEPDLSFWQHFKQWLGF